MQHAEHELAEVVESVWDRREELCSVHSSREALEVLRSVVSLLGKGRLRVCSRESGRWVVHGWLKRAILLYFMSEASCNIRCGDLTYRDKVPPKLALANRVLPAFRCVPPSLVRSGAFVAGSAVLMPSFINIGAYVDQGTMVDAWSTIGSCAQIGRNVHISGGVGIGGVLEPIGSRPVIVEDGCFVGARSEVAEGVLVGEGSVLAMGLHLGSSTKVYDREGDSVSYGNIPPRSVVVPGGIIRNARYALSCAVVVKRVDGRTASKVSLNEALRSLG
ncbi:2,3,4,5-tetrahydropyridine-2,6-dicarboxylate N-succinyltransferase [Candidatus Tremblaya princeps]|uniref:2,3,4,5-tetrahydropyridine-2,6-dicarboxylate N-succinyltransferase n=1 Tax=Tremblaya princeps TaxID=189385 RepID=A0A143WN77_TREPR|nr:2,3,4,5-tetrahydropyridine-2,6-dicarboxylate N-succinyltransferase [Candidatus Tremblaya princeps]